MSNEYSAQKQIFEKNLDSHLQDSNFRRTLIEALSTGYLSADYIDSLQYFRWELVTRPEQVMADMVSPQQQDLDPTLDEFKYEMYLLQNYGVPGAVIFGWITEKLKQ